MMGKIDKIFRENDVLMSIKPHWIAKIANGEKTSEIRKTKPELWTPFKVYMYCTKPDMSLLQIIRDGDENYGEIYHGKPVFIKTFKHTSCGIADKHGKIVGEFTCDAIEWLNNLFEGEDTYHMPKLGNPCLTMEELEKYGQGKRLFGWHITNVKMYKEPKELAEFGLKRPPQSWQFVERKRG